MPHTRTLLPLSSILALCLFGQGCSPDPGGTADDAGQDSSVDASADTGAADASATDTGSTDTGTTDTGAPDMPDPACEGEGDLLVCNPDDPRGLYESDLCMNPVKKKTTCSASLPCGTNSGTGEAYCECPLTGNTACRIEGPRSSLYEPTIKIKERECNNSVDEPNDLLERCDWGSVCFQEEEINDGEALCRRSIDAIHADKPYYNHGCGTFSQWLRRPTKLEIDCRCRTVSDGRGGEGGTGSGFVDPNDVDITMGGFPAGPIVNCASPAGYLDAVWPIEYGQGPAFKAWYEQNASGASWFSGVFNPATREMFAIVKWTNPQYIKSASVVAWNIDTRDRRVVTGLYPDIQTGQQAFGSGYESPQPTFAPGQGTLQPLTGANVIRLGADGMLYTYGGGTGESTSTTREIVRIDPTSGERTLVWMSQSARTGDLTADFGQCFRPSALGDLVSVSFQSQAFEIGPDGTIYLSMRGVREGDGIVTISPDRKTCTVVSRWGGQGHSPGGGPAPVPAPDPIGAGMVLQFPVQGLLLHEGVLYGVSNSDLYSFDLTTGDRANESSGPGYEGIGFSNMFWDPSREVIWAVGREDSRNGAIVDLKTGRSEGIYSDTGLEDFGDEAILRSDYDVVRSVSISMLGNSNIVNYGGAVLDPEDPDIMYAVLKTGALMKMELSTFNTIIHSW